MELKNIAPKLTFEQLDSIMSLASADTNPDYRMGQAFMSRLYDISPELYKELKASGIDPFYTDKEIGNAAEYVCGKVVTFPY